MTRGQRVEGARLCLAISGSIDIISTNNMQSATHSAFRDYDINPSGLSALSSPALPGARHVCCKFFTRIAMMQLFLRVGGLSRPSQPMQPRCPGSAVVAKTLEDNICLLSADGGARLLQVARRNIILPFESVDTTIFFYYFFGTNNNE